MKFIFEPNSIIMMVGPSHCGKSFLAHNLNLELNKVSKSVHLSSDKYRAKLLGIDIHKHEEENMLVSKQAFNMLYNDLDNFTQYPVNYPFVIVDATNISPRSREPIYNIAKRNNYKIVPILFDYSNKEEYFKFADEEKVNRTVINSTLNAYKEMIKTFSYKQFKTSYKIKERITDISVEIQTEPNVGYVNTSENVVVIGDIHGCINEFKELILSLGCFDIVADEMIFKPTDNFPEVAPKIILVGDYIDKNSEENILATIEFIYHNQSFFTVVMGNHERHVLQVLNKQIKRDEKEKELIDNFFETVKYLEKEENAGYLEMFHQLCNSSYYFIEDINKRFIVTHAPCSNSFLLKTDSVSIKSQNTIRYPKREEGQSDTDYMEVRSKFFEYLKTDAEFNNPLHFFGHVEVPRAFSYYNKWGLNTGCCSGGSLTAAVLMGKNKRPFIKKVKSTVQGDKQFYPLFTIEEKSFNPVESLDPKLFSRLKFSAHNGLNFLSGTMCPVDKDKNANDLESLMWGINYYKDKTDEVILQVKEMGSRCNALIHKTDLDKCTLFSRNGYKIKHTSINKTEEEFVEIISKIKSKYNYVFDKLNAEFILFDGELLPWQIMGASLIEKDFVLPYKTDNEEINFLQENGFYSEVEDLLNTESDLKHIIQSQKRIKDFSSNILSYEDHKMLLDKYKEQVDNFTPDIDVDFKAFSILKYIKNNGEEVNLLETNELSNIEVYKLLGNDTYLVVNFKNNSIEYSYNKNVGTSLQFDSYDELLVSANMFYNTIVNQMKREGVVIKPKEMYQYNVAPYLKARGDDYRRIIYGFDYLLPEKYDMLINKKSIKNKLSTSIKEWELGRKLLSIKKDDISLSNKHWCDLCLQLFDAQEFETSLDPRL